MNPHNLPFIALIVGIPLMILRPIIFALANRNSDRYIEKNYPERIPMSQAEAIKEHCIERIQRAKNAAIVIGGIGSLLTLGAIIWLVVRWIN